MPGPADHVLDEELGHEPPDDDDAEPVELGNPDDANRMMRRLRATEREAREVMEIAATDIAQVVAWRDKRLESLGRTIAWCQRSLEGWIRAVHERTGRQSVKLPAGTVSLRKSQPRLDLPELTTAEQAAAWEALAATTIVEGEPVANPVTTKWTLGKRAVAPLVMAGAKIGEPDPDGYQAHQGVSIDGEELPGVIVHQPTRLSFSAKPAASIEDLEADLEAEAG